MKDSQSRPIPAGGPGGCSSPRFVVRSPGSGFPWPVAAKGTRIGRRSGRSRDRRSDQNFHTFTKDCREDLRESRTRPMSRDRATRRQVLRANLGIGIDGGGDGCSGVELGSGRRSRVVNRARTTSIALAASSREPPQKGEKRPRPHQSSCEQGRLDHHGRHSRPGRMITAIWAD